MILDLFSKVDIITVKYEKKTKLLLFKPAYSQASDI